MTPLVLVAGFLGAGKTSFLRQLLPQLPGRGLRARVIINDYQNARVDAASLRALADDVMPISGSCVCCGSREELVEQLSEIAGAPGEVILVEVNGTTATGSLLEILGGASALAHLTPPVQVTLVDALRFGDRAWKNPIERGQVATATHLVLTRGTEVPPERRQQVDHDVAELTGGVGWTTAAAFADYLQDLERAMRPLPDRESLSEATAPVVMDDPAAAGTETPPHTTHHFSSFQVPLPDTVHRASLVSFLSSLPPEVMRAKGIAHLADAPGELRVFQMVSGEVDISDEPLVVGDAESYQPIAIFVGPRIPTLTLRARITKLTA